MTILNELYASGGSDAIIITLELSCDAWLNPIVLCNGFVDIEITTEDSRVLNATATGMDVALPAMDNKGSQNLRFAIDNVRGEAVTAMRMAISHGAEIKLTYRQYVSSNLSEPADNPLHLVVRQFQAKGTQIDVIAGFFDIIDMAYPRKVYNSEFSPGIQFLQ